MCNKLKRTEGIYIPSYDASQIKRNGAKLQVNYLGTLPLSLEILQIKSLAEKHKHPFSEMMGTFSTDVIINLNFEKAFYEYDNEEVVYKVDKDRFGKPIVVQKQKKKKQSSRDALRRENYENGFELNGLKYVEYKRSGSKAKQGGHLFIWEELKEEMDMWTWLGIKFDEDEECDMTSKKAYESLVSSSIVETIEIKPEEILMVDDYKKHTFTTNAKVVYYEDGQLMIKHEPEYKVCNDIFDGQSLLDSSVFENDKAGMKLLRNHFFKSCAFNTNIQKFVRENNIKTVTDMFGNEMDATKIKLITTPNSLKFFKFKNKVDGTMAGAYKYWSEHISSTFGVVKTEHCSEFGHGNYNNMAYQMHQSLPLREGDIEQLLKDDVDYIKMLQSDDNVFCHHITHGKLSVSKDFITSMFAYSKDFGHTDIFKEYRKQTINDYKEGLYHGATKIKGDYYTLCSMPYEMLRWAILKEEPKPLLGAWEVYNSTLEDGQEFTMFRNPHICASSIAIVTNRYRKEFEEYFNFKNEFGGSNIIIIYPYECDIMEKLGGADMDSDVALCIKDKLILERAKEVKDYPVPHSEIKPTKHIEKPKNNMETLFAIDRQLSDNRIGDIVNLSQLLNSYYWNEYFKPAPNKAYLDTVYDNILKLSVLATIEIDKSKHHFDLNMDAIFDEIKNTEVNGKLIIKRKEVEYKKKLSQDDLKKIYELQKQGDFEQARERLNMAEVGTHEVQIRPYFMKFTKYNRNNLDKLPYYWDKEMYCPMNLIVNYLDNMNLRPEKYTKVISFAEFINTDEMNSANREQRKQVLDRIVEYCTERKTKFKAEYNKDKIQFKQELEILEQKCISDIAKKKINVATMQSILFQIYYAPKTKGEQKYKEYYSNRTTILSILYKAQEEVFKQCIYNKYTGMSHYTEDGNKVIYSDKWELRPSPMGTIVIWGERFMKVKSEVYLSE